MEEKSVVNYGKLCKNNEIFFLITRATLQILFSFLSILVVENNEVVKS